jgi:hypothetical protein
MPVAIAIELLSDPLNKPLFLAATAEERDLETAVCCGTNCSIRVSLQRRLRVSRILPSHGEKPGFRAGVGPGRRVVRPICRICCPSGRGFSRPLPGTPISPYRVYASSPAPNFAPRKFCKEPHSKLGGRMRSAPVARVDRRGVAYHPCRPAKSRS